MCSYVLLHSVCISNVFMHVCTFVGVSNEIARFAVFCTFVGVSNEIARFAFFSCCVSRCRIQSQKSEKLTNSTHRVRRA